MRFWINGDLIEAAEARISAVDHGFIVGDGAFETAKIVAGPGGTPVPFALDRHVARLIHSATGLGITPPPSDSIREGMLAVCAANPKLAAGGRLRVTLTSGEGPLGSDRGTTGVTLAMAVAAASAWGPASRLAVSPWPRNELGPLMGLKTTSYADNVVMLAHAKGLGADEAAVPNLAGQLCEGTGSNIFVVLDGVITTPPLSSGCLAGITRLLTVEWCRAAGIAVAEEDIPMAMLAHLEEAFITSSTRAVHPIVEILDGKGGPLWSGPIGERTRAAADVFATEAAANWNP